MIEFNYENQELNASSKVVAFLFAILLFFRCMPYYFWYIEDISRITCSILIPLICISYLKFDKWNFVILIIFSLSFIFLGIARGNNFISFVNILALSLIPLLKRNFIITVFNILKYILSFFLLLSLLNLLFVVLFNIPPFDVINPVNILKDYKYNAYLFLVTPTNPIHQYRFYGIFDEPGVVGTFAAIFLFTDNFKIKGWQNITLFISGILSFSLFFFVVFLVFNLINFKNKYLPLVLFLIILFYFVTYDFLYDYIWWRFEWDFYKGAFAGDNRVSINVKEAIEESFLSYNYFFGHFNNYLDYFQGEASIYVLIYYYGALFVYTNIIGYVVLAYKHLKKRIYIFLTTILFLIMIVYQRPGLFNHIYVFLFTAIINIISYRIDVDKHER